MNITYVALILLAVMNIVLVLVLAFFVYKLLDKKSTIAQVSKDPEVLPRETVPAKQFKKVEPDPKFICAFHPDRDPIGVCAICEQACCESCLREWEHLNFCSEHLKTFAENEWVHITNEMTTPETAEKSSYIYEFKRSLWKLEIPTYIVTHYKIQIEHDFVESYVQLFVRSKDKDELTKKIDEIKKGAFAPRLN